MTQLNVFIVKISKVWHAVLLEFRSWLLNASMSVRVDEGQSAIGLHDIGKNGHLNVCYPYDVYYNMKKCKNFRQMTWIAHWVIQRFCHLFYHQLTCTDLTSFCEVWILSVIEKYSYCPGCTLLENLQSYIVQTQSVNIFLMGFEFWFNFLLEDALVSSLQCPLTCFLPGSPCV